MWNFEIENDNETTLLFHLHPKETVSCPQYLVVARFIIPPNLLEHDNYGQHLWTMLPSSTLNCSKCGTLSTKIFSTREWKWGGLHSLPLCQRVEETERGDICLNQTPETYISRTQSILHRIPSVISNWNWQIWWGESTTNTLSSHRSDQHYCSSFCEYAFMFASHTWRRSLENYWMQGE